MREYTGVTVSEGLVMGPVRRIDRGVSGLGRLIHDRSKERALFEAAVVLAKDELRGLMEQADGDERDMLRFQLVMLDDQALLTEISNYIAAGAGSAAATERAGQIFARRIRDLPDEYLRQRGADVLDVCSRVVEILDGKPRQKLELEQPAILAAESILPSDIISIDRGMVLGIATSKGSAQSHAAIVARTMGIPAVIELGEEFLKHCDGHEAVLDALEGRLILDPNETLQQQVRRQREEMAREKARLAGLRGTPCITRDGVPVSLLANCSEPGGIEQAVAEGAEGVGLLRTEFFLMKGSIPDEEEQYYFYSSCLAAAQGRPVTVRTFDVGADKLVEGMMLPEKNPALGLRGLRFCLERRDLFQDQLCALLRAATKGPMDVMFPMVGGVMDFRMAMDEVEKAKANLRMRGLPFDENLKFGCMIEVPSAALCAAELAAAGAAFFSIGTNDLIQYTHAVDRMDARLDMYYKADSLAIQRMIAMTARAAREAGIPVCVCGRAAADPKIAPLYVKLGVSSLSMASQSLMDIKEVLLNTDLSEVPSLA